MLPSEARQIVKLLEKLKTCGHKKTFDVAIEYYKLLAAL